MNILSNSTNYQTYKQLHSLNKAKRADVAFKGVYINPKQVARFIEPSKASNYNVARMITKFIKNLVKADKIAGDKSDLIVDLSKTLSNTNLPKTITHVGYTDTLPGLPIGSVPTYFSHPPIYGHHLSSPLFLTTFNVPDNVKMEIPQIKIIKMINKKITGIVAEGKNATGFEFFKEFLKEVNKKIISNTKNNTLNNSVIKNSEEIIATLPEKYVYFDSKMTKTEFKKTLKDLIKRTNEQA